MSIVTALLFTIVMLLNLIAIILFALLRKQQTAPKMISIAPGVDEAIERLKQSVEHHVDVSAVVGMINSFDTHPGALERLKNYPEDVRAAAWLHYINGLGAALQRAQKSLKQALEEKYITDPYIELTQRKVDTIRAKLDAAIAASGQKIGPRSV